MSRLLTAGVLQQVKNRQGGGIAPLIIPTNPYVLYDFSDLTCYPGSGTSVFDLSGNSRTGTIVGSNYSVGTNEMVFTGGTGTLIEVPISLDLTVQDYSLIVFARVDVGTNITNALGMTVNGLDSQHYVSMRIRANSYPYFYFGDGTTNQTLIMTSESSNAPNYNMMAISRPYFDDISTSKTYFRYNDYTDSSPDYTLRPTNVDRLIIGGDYVKGTLAGAISVAIMYDRTLTEQELADIYTDTFLNRH